MTHVTTVYVVRGANGEYLHHQSGRAQWSWGPAEGMKIWFRKAHAISAARKNTQRDKTTLRHAAEAEVRDRGRWPSAIAAEARLPLEVVELEIVELAYPLDEGYAEGGEVRPAHTEEEG